MASSPPVWKHRVATLVGIPFHLLESTSVRFDTIQISSPDRIVMFVYSLEEVPAGRVNHVDGDKDPVVVVSEGG